MFWIDIYSFCSGFHFFFTQEAGKKIIEQFWGYVKSVTFIILYNIIIITKTKFFAIFWGYVKRIRLKEFTPFDSERWNIIKRKVSPVLEEYSMLLVSFHLQRHMGNFLIQVYGPCVLLVVLSWVSFWLNREATADRVSLGKFLSSPRKSS